MQLIKYLQAQGLGSRKTCQWLIDRGLVSINGQTAGHARAEIAPDSVHELRINGEAFTVVPRPYFYILLNKPAGYETSHKPRDYPSVFSLFPDHMRNIDMQAVGRLDADTTGVLLITNDGQFNHRLTSPKHKVAKRYRATLKHPADSSLCDTLCSGVLLHDDNETVAAAAAGLADEHTLILTITEGRYHQVKRMVAAAGNRVEQLHRLDFGGWQADHLPAGGWTFFTP
ncbi:16S rRNA pseudouridine(516) synthase [Neisseria leonii]|uniref:Pseudouridine synthase n=1 Tax=Neisseria leonii TaxID=2995413 RepID=A0A9X4IAH6_9NEIS|nr:16S rRNA pseudouridine(516) synthase [Neisseria sp. 51.81]MDD9327400.1 pseudouridine synthase [Neisseria sp. 51.81]